MFMGMGFQAGTGGIFDVGNVFGTVGGGEVSGPYGTGGDGGGGGGGWSWAGSLAQIISAGGSAIEKVAGSITGHQAQYNATPQYQQLPPQQVAVNPNNLSLDRTAGDITGFLSRNIVPVGLAIVAVLLFRSGRK